MLGEGLEALCPFPHILPSFPFGCSSISFYDKSVNVFLSSVSHFSKFLSPSMGVVGTPTYSQSDVQVMDNLGLAVGI